MAMTITDIIYKKTKEHTKKALDGRLELIENENKLLISNIYNLNSSTKRRRFQ